MGILFSFKKPEIRRFNYIPRYYNPQKEEMQERRERIRKQLESGERRNSGLTQSLQRGFLSEQRTKKSDVAGSSLRMAVIITVVVGFLYYIFR